MNQSELSTIILCAFRSVLHSKTLMSTLCLLAQSRLDSPISLKLNFLAVFPRAEDRFFLYVSSVIISFLSSSDFRPASHNSTMLVHLNPILFYVLTGPSYWNLRQVLPLPLYQLPPHLQSPRRRRPEAEAHGPLVLMEQLSKHLSQLPKKRSNESQQDGPIPGLCKQFRETVQYHLYCILKDL